MTCDGISKSFFGLWWDRPLGDATCGRHPASDARCSPQVAREPFGVCLFDSPTLCTSRAFTIFQLLIFLAVFLLSTSVSLLVIAMPEVLHFFVISIECPKPLTLCPAVSRQLHQLIA